MTESELVKRCRAGDREAQRELYTRTCPRIYRLLTRMTRDPNTASDLAQDTYVKALTRMDQFDGRSTIATWLYRIAVRQALQYLRREKRTGTHQRQDADENWVAPVQADTSVRLDVTDALAALEPSERAVLLLRYHEGLDYRSIASVLDCAEGTVASRLNRARQRLRTLLEGGYSRREEIRATAHPKKG